MSILLKSDEKVLLTCENLHYLTRDAMNKRYVKIDDRGRCYITTKRLVLTKEEGLIKKIEKTIVEIPYENTEGITTESLLKNKLVITWHDSNKRWDTVLSGTAIENIGAELSRQLGYHY